MEAAGLPGAYLASVTSKLVEAAGRRSFALDESTKGTIHAAKGRKFEPVSSVIPTPMMTHSYRFLIAGRRA